MRVRVGQGGDAFHHRRCGRRGQYGGIPVVSLSRSEASKHLQTSASPAFAATIVIPFHTPYHASHGQEKSYFRQAVDV